MPEPLSLTALTIASSVASITGRGVFDMLSTIRQTKYNQEMAKRLMELCETVKNPNDPLVGRWSLRQWSYQVPKTKENVTTYHPSNFHVQGDMRILYYDPSKKIWHGFLSLNYTHKNKFLKSKRNFVGVYRVEFMKTSRNKFKGFSEIIGRKPKSKKTYKGDFSGFALKDREFTGEFANVESTTAPPAIAKPVKFQGPMKLDSTVIKFLSLSK